MQYIEIIAFFFPCVRLTNGKNNVTIQERNDIQNFKQRYCREFSQAASCTLIYSVNAKAYLFKINQAERR